MVPVPPNNDLGTSTTVLNTLVPANESAPGLLKLEAVPAIIFLYCVRSKKNGSSLVPANTLIPVVPVATTGAPTP